ncbi:MAG: hypothetical protein IJW21_03005 [Clostridia bacterium]|nr:hypothetical protein [Clostridia bacterium]
MKKKEIKKLLLRFDEAKIPDKYKILEGCGAEYRYRYKEKKERYRRNLLPALLIFIIMSVIALFATAAANIEDMQKFFSYVEYRIRYYYADGSYTDKVFGSYVDKTASTSATLYLPSGIVVKPEYEASHKKDVSADTMEVKNVGAGSIMVHIEGGESFMVYKNAVRLERMPAGEDGAEWEKIFDRTVFEYHSDGSTLTPTTGVMEGGGDFTSNIEGLGAMLSQDTAGKYKYRITLTVCSAEGEQDFGEVSAEFFAPVIPE